MRWTMLVVACTVMAGLLVGGCGGGGEDLVGSAGTTLEGTVYTSSISTAAAENGAAAQGTPVPDCEVTVERVRDRQELASGRTNDEGRYRFEGLPTGDDVLVRARLRSGELLQARTGSRLSTGTGYSPLIIIDPNQAGSTTSGGVYYGRIERRMNARLEFIVSHIRVEIVDIDVEHMNLSLIESKVDEHLDKLN